MPGEEIQMTSLTVIIQEELTFSPFKGLKEAGDNFF